MTADPLAKYRLNKLQEEPQVPFSSSVDNQQDPLQKYRVAKPNSEEESFTQYVTRNAARLGSRVAEQIGGLPGDISDLIQSGVFAGLEKAIGHKVTPEMREEARILSERPPTSSELKKASESVTKGYTSPQGEYEKTADEFAETVASLLGPMKFRKALGIAALGTGAKTGLKTLGFAEGTQEAGKIGTMLIASMVNPKGVKQLTSNLYNEAERLAPEGTIVSGKELEKDLLKLKHDLEKGTLDRFETKVLEQTNRVLEKVKDGNVDVNHLIASKRSINGVAGDPEFYRRGEHLFPRLLKAVDKTIKSHKDPEFLKTYQSANEAFGGVEQSKKISRYIESKLGNKPIKHALLASVAETVAGYPEAIGPTLALSGGAYLGVKGIELTQRILANKTLRNYYFDVLLNASKENSTAMIKSANKLEKALDQP